MNLIADTNVLVRLVLRDDADQARVARAFFLKPEPLSSLRPYSASLSG